MLEQVISFKSTRQLPSFYLCKIESRVQVCMRNRNLHETLLKFGDNPRSTLEKFIYGGGLQFCLLSEVLKLIKGHWPYHLFNPESYINTIFQIFRVCLSGPALLTRKCLNVFHCFIQHFFIFRPSDSIVSEDAGTEPRTVATSAFFLAVRRSSL